MIVIPEKFDFHSFVPELARDYGFRWTLDDQPSIIQPHITEPQNRVSRSDQKFENGKEKAIGDLPAKLAIHFTGDEKTPA